MYLLLQLKIFLLLFIIIVCDTTQYECDKNHDKDPMPNSWSMIVSIRYDCQHTNDLLTHCCSGTILTESYILTAADCVNRLSSNVSLADVTIAAGIIHNQSESGQIIRKVDQIIIHPNWTHNIALLHLSTPLDFTKDKYITRTCRPTHFNLPEDVLQYPSKSSRLLSIGWDSTKKRFDARDTANLQKIEMSLVDSNDPICNDLVHNIEQQFCVRLYHHRKDSCKYESGEPILQWIDNHWMQVGIISFVAQETSESCLSVYTRLIYYHEWLESVLNFKSVKSYNSAAATDSITNLTKTYKCNVNTVSCGCSAENVKLSSTRIIGGEEAVRDSWTMSVSIRLNDFVGHSCGGSILTRSYILTSAHCIDGASLEDISIAAGMHNRIEDFAMIRYVHGIYIHPNWNGNDGTYQNDIAILYIFPPLPVHGNGYYAQTCVPYIGSLNETVKYPQNGTHLVVVGWGSTKYGDNMSDTLQQASVYMIDNNDPICSQSIHNVETQFCAGMYGGDPCQGDSGAPIFQWKDTYWEQVGITSYGGRCDHSGSPGIYTRLSYYFDWMESVINSSLTTTTQKPPTGYICNKTSSCGCGKVDVALTTRIIGGEDAIEDSWPMIVSLRLHGTTNHSCGGTILSKSYILTAAHCFRQISIETPTGITIAAGMINRSDSQQIIRNVDRIYIHPNYTSTPNDFRHDIALLHIDQPFIFESDSSLTKTCIHRIDPPLLTNQYPKNGTLLATIGWGVLRFGTEYIPEILQQVQVFTIDNEDPTCLNTIEDTEIQFCAGLFEGGKDSCQGDSGGPIFQWTGQYWEQVGITSYGYDCALAGFPGIYTRLSYYYQWIEGILKLDGEHLEPEIVPYITTVKPTLTSTSKMDFSTATLYQTMTSSSAYKYKFYLLIFEPYIVSLFLLYQMYHLNTIFI